MGPDDLIEFDTTLLSQARAVVSLRECFSGNRSPRVIGLRHDIDNEPGGFECGLRMAAWEASKGYRSTYYLLHTAAYWQQPDFPDGVRELALLGHEVGIHNDALGAVVEAGSGDPYEVFADALEELRGFGVNVRSTVGHGNRSLVPLKARNDELFVEGHYQGPYMGSAGREIAGVRLGERKLADYGLDFEAARTLKRGFELTDSGGHGWVDPGLPAAVKRWSKRRSASSGISQLHVNQHCDWWIDAFPA